MIFRNVFFVGYFNNSEEKKSFTNLFECTNKIFLESSKSFIKSNSRRIKFFPMHVFAIQGSRFYNLIFDRVEVDSLFIKLYKRDLKIFLNSYINKPLPKSNSSYFLFCYWVFQSESVSCSFFNPLSYLRPIGKILKKEGVVDEKSFRDLRALKIFAFRLSFLSGYIYINKLFSNLDINKDDLFIIWGAHNTGASLLIDKLKKAGMNYFISEYGELPGTISVNKDGIFGDSFIAHNWGELINTDLDSRKIKNVESYIKKLVASQSSSRNRSQSDETFLLYHKLFKQKEQVKKIIYVSGVELIASGHLFNSDYFGENTLNANNMLLSSVVTHFDDSGYLILYKDHPLMQKNYKNLILEPSEFPNVIFLNSLNVDNLVSMADITITLPSKVVMTSLLYRKPVYVFGKFSIPENVPELGYYMGNDIIDIKNIIGNTEIDETLYNKLVAIIITNYLICYNDSLIEGYDFYIEKEKLNNIMSSQIDFKKT